MQLRRVLITGGSGFLGRAIVAQLRDPAAAGLVAPEETRVYDVRLQDGVLPAEVVAITGDVRDRDGLRRACEGVDAVIHAASLVDYGHASETMLEAINVGGTQNVVEACREAGVGILVYTSTMDVVHAGGAISMGDESLPYPPHFADAYARTKATAEQHVLAASGADLLTCALRPCGLYGEADPYHLSNVLRVVGQGRLAARLGDGRALFQHVYVGNVAHAHLRALERLAAGDGQVAGQAFFITDYPAINFFDFMEPFVRGLGLDFPPRSRSLPFPLAYALGALLELVARALRPLYVFRPNLTRSSVRVVCQDLCFHGEKAARLLGYRPIFSEAEAFDRTLAWFREHGPVALTPTPES
jgi:sterol-4alpha-carboxylate 3-dehydrogenase (decarboxylating)